MKLKALVLAGVLAVSGMIGVFGAVDTYAVVTCPTGSLQQTADSLAECNLPSTETQDDKKLMNTVVTILNVVIGAVGIITVAMIVIGGVFYTTSIGDAAKTKRAMHTILYGIVGLVICLLAFAIVNFVLSSVFGGGTATDKDANKDKKTNGYVRMIDDLA